MIRIVIGLFLWFFGILAGMAQSITAKITDSQTGAVIPYATIKLNDTEHLVSNEEGYFSIPENKSKDETVLKISHMGYVPFQTTVSDLVTKGNVIKLQPGVFQLENVTVSNVKPDPYAIMAKVKSQLVTNYSAPQGKYSKNMMFFRNSEVFTPERIEVEITKSTGFSRTALKEVNTDIKKLTQSLITKPPKEYQDVLCQYYNGVYKKNPDKSITGLPKLEVLKAIKLKDKDRSASFDDLEDTAMRLFLKHLDTTKYYRIKSGIIGSKDTVSFKKDPPKKGKNNMLDSYKSRLMVFLGQQSLLFSKKLDFIKETELYDYTYEGVTFNEKDELIYILGFEPRKRKAKYKGKLYVSESDYAVVRVDYGLVEGKKVSGLNLKLIFGVKYAENVSKGTLIYKKNKTDEPYQLHYASVENGQYFYISRPLKFIELSDADKDVVAFDFLVEGNTLEKEEYLNISNTEISESDFEKFKENEFNYTVKEHYDPKMWGEFTTLEPLEAMKAFKAND